MTIFGIFDVFIMFFISLLIVLLFYKYFIRKNSNKKLAIGKTNLYASIIFGVIGLVWFLKFVYPELSDGGLGGLFLILPWFGFFMYTITIFVVGLIYILTNKENQ